MTLRNSICATFFSRNTVAEIVMPLVVMFLPVIAELFPKTLQYTVIPTLPASVTYTFSNGAVRQYRIHRNLSGVHYYPLHWIYETSAKKNIWHTDNFYLFSAINKNAYRPIRCRYFDCHVPGIGRLIKCVLLRAFQWQ